MQRLIRKFPAIRGTLPLAGVPNVSEGQRLSAQVKSTTSTTVGQMVRVRAFATRYNFVASGAAPEISWHVMRSISLGTAQVGDFRTSTPSSVQRLQFLENVND